MGLILSEKYKKKKKRKKKKKKHENFVCSLKQSCYPYISKQICSRRHSKIVISGENKTWHFMGMVKVKVLKN